MFFFGIRVKEGGNGLDEGEIVGTVGDNVVVVGLNVVGLDVGDFDGGKDGKMVG